MFRVRAIGVVAIGMLIAASAQAQQPGGPPAFQAGPMPVMMVPGGPLEGPLFQGPAPVAFQGPAPVAPAVYDAPQYGPAPVQQAGFHGGHGGCDCCGPMMGGHGPCLDGFCAGHCPPHGHVVVCNVDIEASILVADLRGNAASGAFASPTVPVLATYSTLTRDLDDDVYLTPRIWLHCQKCEWGLGLRAWQFDGAEARFTPFDQLQLNIVGDYTSERLHARTIDGVVTYSWHSGFGHPGMLLGGTAFQLDFGLRHVELETDALAFGSALMGDVIATNTAVARSEFDGVGITGGLRGTKHLWHRVSLYWSLRASILFGDLDVRTQTSANAVGVGDAAAALTVAGATSSEELFIGEAQLGIQWEHRLQCVPACCFFRIAAEFQHWDLDSPIFATSDATVNVATIPGTIASATSEATARAPELNFYGVTFGAGLTW